MAFCQKCGKEINDEAVVCVHCGCATGRTAVQSNICRNCGKELEPNALACTNCGTPTANSSHPADRPANGGEIALAILFPLIGAILYYAYKNDKPTASKTLNKVSLIAFLCWFLVGILRGCIGAM